MNNWVKSASPSSEMFAWISLHWSWFCSYIRIIYELSDGQLATGFLVFRVNRLIPVRLVRNYVHIWVTWLIVFQVAGPIYFDAFSACWTVLLASRHLHFLFFLRNIFCCHQNNANILSLSEIFLIDIVHQSIDHPMNLLLSGICWMWTDFPGGAQH